MKQLKRVIVMVCGAFGVMGLQAATWYANAANAGKTEVEVEGVKVAVDGSTPARGFGTLQDAHDKAANDDTIYLMPGIYTEGCTDDVGKSRLVVTKKLYFRAYSGKASDTIIQGTKDPDTINNSSFAGVGPNAVRCVRLSSGSTGTQFHHITFRGGATANTSALEDFTAVKEYNGGCISCATSSCFIDCVIEQGVARGVGGGVVSIASVWCKLIRCVVDGCYGTSWGSSVAYGYLWCCVVSNSRNDVVSRPAVAFGRLINCSVYGVNGTGVDKGCQVYNTVFGYLGQDDVGNQSGGAAVYENSYCKTNLMAGSSNFYQCFMAPAARDYRLIPGTAAVNGGKTQYLTSEELFSFPTGVERTDFNGNAIDTASVTCHAGAVQDVKAPVGGRIDLAAGYVLNGYTNALNSYVRADHWPNTFHLLSSDPKFLRFKHGGNYYEVVGSFFYPDLAGTAKITTPPPTRANEVYAPTYNTWSLRYWCDASASAEDADGSEEHPFPTLQAAIDAAKASSETVVQILVKPGNYCTGGGISRDHNCRVAIPSGLVPIIQSTGGPDVTFITGAADPNPPDNDNYPGCGPNSVRCVGAEASNSNFLLQGFTLRNGYTDVPGGGDNGDCAGAVYGAANYGFQVWDCKIVNCHGAGAPGIGHASVFNRCQFSECTSAGTFFGYSHIMASVVESSCTATKGIFGAHSDVEFSTAPSATFKVDSSETSSCKGCLFGKDSLTGFNGTSIANFEEPCYAHAAAGDYRLMSISPVLTQDWNLSAADETTLLDIFCANIHGDVACREYLSVADKSLPVLGAIQETLAGVYVDDATNGGCELADDKATARGYVASELPITVQKVNTFARPFLGVIVNGVTNDFSTADAFTITAADLAAANGALRITPCYTPDWYVAIDGNDANTGFKATEARTLATTLADTRLQAGDIIHAAAGRYTSGTGVIKGTGDVNDKVFRVVLPAGVSLQGAGIGQTFIVGQKDETATGDENGFGPNAVRGVYLSEGASVKNLTITDCWTEQGGNDGDDSVGDGGGVLTADWRNVVQHPNYCVEDCLITNCWASGVGGGACGARLIRTKLFYNHALLGGGATCFCELYGCLTDYSYQGSSYTSSANYRFVTAVNSTLGRNNRTFTDSTGNAAVGNNTNWGMTSTLKNCLILGSIRVVGEPAVNCIYASTILDAYASNFSTCTKATLEEINLDANYVPCVGASVALDAGDGDVYAANQDILGEVDLYGTQRIYNGAIDVGAVEADWRTRYAQDMAQDGRFAVDVASPTVSEVDGVVKLAAGDKLVSTWVGSSKARCTYTITIKVSGTKATVQLGDDVREVAANAENQTLTFTKVASNTSLFFDNLTNDGTLEILSVNRTYGTVIYVR